MRESKRERERVVTVNFLELLSCGKRNMKFCTVGADPKHNKENTFLKPESTKIKGATKLSKTKAGYNKNALWLERLCEFP
jgi:hypothetical protein